MADTGYDGLKPELQRLLKNVFYAGYSEAMIATSVTDLVDLAERRTVREAIYAEIETYLTEITNGKN